MAPQRTLQNKHSYFKSENYTTHCSVISVNWSHQPTFSLARRKGLRDDSVNSKFVLLLVMMHTLKN